MPGRTFVGLQPLRNVAEIDGGNGRWKVTGPSCMFRLVPSPAGLPEGWTDFTFRVGPDAELRKPAFHVNCGEGYRPIVTLVLAGPTEGRQTVACYVPPDAVEMAMNANAAVGPLVLELLTVYETSRLRVASRLALSYGLRGVHRPRRIAQTARTFGAALLAGGLDGLRGAIASAVLWGEAFPKPAQARAADGRYMRWLLEEEDDAQPAPLVGAPSFSVLITVGPEEAERVGVTLETLRNQLDIEWNCLIGVYPGADASLAQPDQNDAADARVARLPLPTAERGEALGFLANAATGDFLIVLDAGDCLAPGALAAFASAPEFAILHGDEDQIDADGNRSAPFLKPEWSPELLSAFNYFGRPTALRRELVEQAGGFAATLGAGTEWDLHLRLTAGAAKIKRVPRILCHRHHGSDGDRPPQGSLEAAQRRAAVAAHWKRQDVVATVSTQPDGTQRSVWQMESPPLVSVVIVKRSASAWFAARLSDLLEATRYPRLQVIVVGGGPDDQDAPAPRLEPKGPRHVEFIRVPEHLGCYAACNAGALAAEGELLLFVDVNVVAADPDWLAEMARFAARPGVGVVGTMSTDPDGMTRQAGISIEVNMFGALFHGAPPAEWGPIGSPMLPRTVTAVAGVCQMVRREVFERVGGFDEAYVGANGDVALCLAARAAGWRVAYAPFAHFLQTSNENRGLPVLAADVTRIARDIRRFGYRQDPFFHPALDAGGSIPRLRLGVEPGKGASLGRSLDAALAGVVGPAPLDLGDDTEMEAEVGVPIEALLWPPPRPDAVNDRWSAVRWCLDLVRRRPDLRGRFPNALSAGASGSFGRWLAAEGARAFALSPAAAGHVRAALDAGVAARARQAVLVAAKSSDEMAFAFLPPGRAALFAFLLRRSAASFRLEEIWWLALECAEDPIRELALVYRFRPDWQSLFPDGLTVFGQRRFADWLGAVHGWDPTRAQPLPWAALAPADNIRLGWNANGSWQRHHPNPFDAVGQAHALLDWLRQPDSGLPDVARDWLATQPMASLAQALAVPGVNVMGHFCYPSGLRTSVLSVAEGLRAAGYNTSLRNVPADAEQDMPNYAAFAGLEQYDTTLMHIQPEPFFKQAFERSGLRARAPRTYRIGYWYWELEAAPGNWANAVADVDEAWAATRFVADALTARFDVPVFNLMPGVELPPFSRRPLSAFGVPPDRFTFLFAFHMASVMERKNPLGLIRAFRLAFSEAEPVTLVLKTFFGDRHPVLMKQLHAAASEAGGRVIVIDHVFTAEETISLMDACDSYISLHRSEGLGLTMAEAMLLAKPVIATGYSGNLDFMNPANSLLVDYRPVVIDQVIPPYELGCVWAEPSEDHAARLMRQVWENPGFAAELGARGRADVRANLSVAAAGRRMADRLSVICLQRESRGLMVGLDVQGQR